MSPLVEDIAAVDMEKGVAHVSRDVGEHHPREASFVVRLWPPHHPVDLLHLQVLLHRPHAPPSGSLAPTTSSNTSTAPSASQCPPLAWCPPRG